jgi:hypothetical protein
MDTHDIIATFVDRERVDAEALKAALASDEGRDYLIDLLALRELVADQPGTASLARATGVRSRWRNAGALAAALVLIAAGYLAGTRHAAPTPSAMSDASVSTTSRPLATSSDRGAAPAPTSIILLEPGLDWHQLAVN